MLSSWAWWPNNNACQAPMSSLRTDKHTTDLRPLPPSLPPSTVGESLTKASSLRSFKIVQQSEQEMNHRCAAKLLVNTLPYCDGLNGLVHMLSRAGLLDVPKATSLSSVEM